MRIEQMTCRGWLALGCVGVLFSVTIACDGGAFPTAPSTTSVIGPGPSGSSNLANLMGGSCSSNTATSAGGSGAANVGRLGPEGAVAKKTKRIANRNQKTSVDPPDRSTGPVNAGSGRGAPRGRLTSQPIVLKDLTVLEDLFDVGPHPQDRPHLLLGGQKERNRGKQKLGN